jgi:AmiR/NasT family two-component response regulator
VNKSLELLARLAAQESAAPVRKRFDDVMQAIRSEMEKRSYVEQAARIAEMETALIDAKIAARVSGLLEDGTGGTEAIGAVEDHVEGVLRPSPFAAAIEQTLREVQEEIAERGLMAKAKAMLQRARGMSEHQAHLHLRGVSRKSRKPLREIAREVIEEESRMAPCEVTNSGKLE